MYNKTIIVFVFFLQSISFSSNIDTGTFSSTSSNDKTPNQYSITGGPVIAYKELGISLAPEFYYHNTLYSISGTISSEFNLFGPSPTEHTAEVSFLIGKRRNFKYRYVSISAGLSYLNMYRRGKLLSPSSGGQLSPDEYEAKYYSTIGVPVKAEAALKLYYVGIGFQIMININTIAPSIGFGPILYFGTYKSPEVDQ